MFKKSLFTIILYLNTFYSLKIMLKSIYIIFKLSNLIMNYLQEM